MDYHSPPALQVDAVSRGLCGVYTHLKGVKGYFIITNVQAQERRRMIQKNEKGVTKKKRKKEAVAIMVVLSLSLSVISLVPAAFL